jgi:hypothetical protein
LGDYAKLFFTGNDDDPYETKVRANGGHLAVKARRNYRSDLEKYILPDPVCQKSIPLIRRNDSIDFRDRMIALFGFSRKAKRIFQAYKNVIHTALEKGLTQIDSVQRLNVAYTKQKRPATTWTLPHLVDRKISKDYKQEGETDGKKGHRTAKLRESV